MSTNAVTPARSAQPGRQAEEVDCHLARRIRHRRQMLGLSQQELGARIGVSSYQVCKYETGENRVAAAQLYALARALGVEIGYFYEGDGEASRQRSPPSPDRLLMELVRSFLAIPDRHLQEAVCQLTRAVAEQDAAGTTEADDGAA
ncbi:MAG: helix-turn-helix domain-containing protein [Geminicoccaceae bacterium]